MAIFWTLFFKIIPLFLNVLIGYSASKILKIERDSIARLVFYIVSPIIIFNSVAKAPITSSTLMLPVIVYIVSSILCLSFYYFAKFAWQDSTRNVLALSAGNGNTGYFGLPIAIELFDEQTVGLYVVAMLGVVMFESSLGFFITARGNYSAKESIKKILKLPMLHAFILGCLFSYFKIPITNIFNDFIINIRGCYITLGMALIGIGIASVAKFEIDMKFIGMSFTARFLIWPLIIYTMIFLDNNFFRIYDGHIHDVLMLLSIVPLGANTVVIASILNARPEKAAFAVLLSTIIALIYVPIMCALFIEG